MRFSTVRGGRYVLLAPVAALMLGPIPVMPANAAAPAKDACVSNIADVIAAPSAPAMATAPLPATLSAKLQAALEASFKQAAAPGAIVGVRTPEGTWQAAIGKADPAKGTPMAIGMHTRIGSLTKTFVGTMILQLVEDGKLSLDDPIAKYVAGVPNGDRISILQLADMTSGVASYTRSAKFTDKYFADPETVFKPSDLLAAAISESPLFEPGAAFDYSNTNFILLGMVIEKVTGKSIGTMFKERILDPLKLANTSWPGESPDLPAPYADGLTLQGDTAKPDAPANATHWNPAWGWTAGEMISDLDDLLTYGHALVTGQGLLDASLQTRRLTFPGPAGYGIAIGCIDGWVGHTGTLPGYETTLYFDTRSGTTVVVQANSDIMTGDCSDSPVPTGNDRSIACLAPATRIFAAISAALGHPFKPNPQH